MNVNPTGPAIPARVAAQESEGAPAYQVCDQCSAPVEANQRYCVVCGARRKHVYDPAARYLSAASSRSRSVGPGSRPVSSRRRRSFGLGTAALLAVIPLAVAVGVLVGRSANGNDAGLIAALRAQKATVVNVAGGGVSSPAASTSAVLTAVAGPLASDFSLQSGYAVELQTLPGSGTTRGGVTAAEQSARTKGATAVGLINQSAFRVTPRPPAGAYVIYSGQYKAKSAADAALAKLTHRFPAAKVIAVQSNRAPATSASGKVLATSVYGSAHQVTGFKPSASQLATGRRLVEQIGKQINSNYVNSQKGLPDAISVP